MVGMQDGHRNECKRCNLDQKAARHRANPQPARDRARQWQIDNAQRVAENNARYRESGRKAISDRKSHLKRKYGITPEEYDTLLAQQGGVCGICGREPNRGISLHVDHDHATGAVRGLLCFRCNNALGDFDDDPVLLRAAAAYLGPEPAVDEAIGARLEALKALARQSA